MDEVDIESEMPGYVMAAYRQIADNQANRPRIMNFSVEFCHGDPARGIQPHYIRKGVNVAIDQIANYVPEPDPDYADTLQFMPKVVRTYPTDAPCRDCGEKLGMI